MNTKRELGKNTHNYISCWAHVLEQTPTWPHGCHLPTLQRQCSTGGMVRPDGWVDTIPSGSARSWWKRRDCYYHNNLSSRIKLLGMVWLHRLDRRRLAELVPGGTGLRAKSDFLWVWVVVGIWRYPMMRLDLGFPYWLSKCDHLYG